ncbi:hypothetical protein BDK51DRAFT_13338, partial [Blyttiomyces helicus]
GHSFKLRQYYKPTDCAVCREAFWATTNQGLECSVCKFICHRACKPLIDVTCHEVFSLNSVQPMYFLAADTQDRSRWLAGLEYFRKEVE